MSDDRNFIYANSTYEVGKPAGIAGYVIKFSPERLEDLIAELSGNVDSELGVTLFMNVFENQGENKETGDKYIFLSTSINAAPTEESPKYQSNDSKKSAARGRIAKAAKSVSRTSSRRQGRR